MRYYLFGEVEAQQTLDCAPFFLPSLNQPMFVPYFVTLSLFGRLESSPVGALLMQIGGFCGPNLSTSGSMVIRATCRSFSIVVFL